MPLNLPTNRSVLGEHEQATDGHPVPAETLPRDFRREPHLGVMTPERLFDGGELGFELHDEQGPGCRMPPEEVDRSALPEDGVGDFGHDEPAQRFESLDHQSPE